MRRASLGAVAACSAILLVGCADGGSGSTPAPTSSPTSSSPSALPTRDGLVGAIDAARLLAFCENVRLARTANDGGLQSSAREAWAGALTVLTETAPGAARDLASRLRAIERRRGLAAAITAAERTCA